MARVWLDNSTRIWRALARAYLHFCAHQLLIIHVPIIAFLQNELLIAVTPDPSVFLEGLARETRIVPSSSIEAANAKVRIQRRRPIPKIVCMVVLPLQWASNALVDMPMNHRFNTEGHSPAAVLLVGVVQLGLNLEIYSTKKLDSGNLENLVPRK